MSKENPSVIGRAWEGLCRNLPLLLACLAITVLPSIAVGLWARPTVQAAQERMQQAAELARSTGVSLPFRPTAVELLASCAPLLVSLLVVPLVIGMYRVMLGLERREEVSFRTFLSGVTDRPLRSVLLSLACTFLILAPLLAAVLLGILSILLTRSGVLTVILALAGSIAMVVLTLQLAFSQFSRADVPEASVRECLRRSRALSVGYRWKIFWTDVVIVLGFALLNTLISGPARTVFLPVTLLLCNLCLIAMLTSLYLDALSHNPAAR